MSLYSFTSIRYGGHEVSVLLKEVNLFQGMINYLSWGDNLFRNTGDKIIIKILEG